MHMEGGEENLGVIISNQRQSPHLPCSHHIPSTECWIHCLFINKTGGKYQHTIHTFFNSVLQGRVETTGSLQKRKVLVLKEVAMHFM